MPRLSRFRERHPDIELAVSASTSVTDFLHESTDIGVHYGTGGYADMDAIPLGDVELFPVCRPDLLLNGREPPSTLDALSSHTLLHDDALRLNERKDWRHWLQGAGAPDLSLADHGIHFNQAALAYEAAIQGHGVALAKNVLVSWDLRLGRLVRPFEYSCPTGLSYWSICRPSRSNEAKVAAFRDWLVHEMLPTEARGPEAIG
jgi:LysR family glycine cleavage system transcriptional activator